MMKFKHLRSKITGIAAVSALCAVAGTPARAVDKTFTGSSGDAEWDCTNSFIWSPPGAPTGADKAIFPSSSSSTTIYLTNIFSTNPPPIASDLVFDGNYDIVGGSGSSPFGHPLVDTLTLTHGDVTVNGTAEVDIHANIALPSGGTLTKYGSGFLGLYETVKGNVMVQEGTVFGAFTVAGNLTNNAWLAGGSANFSNGTARVQTGKITVNGNFTQGKTGTLFVPIADGTPQGASQLDVKGSAGLGGQLTAVWVNGFNPKDGDKFKVITAQGGIKDKFDLVDSLSGPGVFALYDNNSVTLVVGAGGSVQSFVSQVGTLTGNQQGVANNLLAVLGNPKYNDAFNFIGKSGVNNFTHNLDRIAPEEMNSMQNVGNSTAQVHSANVQGRTSVIRSGFGTALSTTGFSAQGLAINGEGPGYSGQIAFRTGAATGAAGPRGDDGKESKEVKEVIPAEDRWGVFLTGSGEWMNVGDTQNARGFDLTSGGLTLGVDYKLTPYLAVGLMFGYTGTSVDLVDNGRTWVNGGKVGIYSTVFSGGWYADAAVTGGYNSYDNRRSALGGDARSTTEGGDLNVLIGTGYDFKRGNFTFGPTASFNYTYIGVDGYTEDGSLIPLNVNGSHTESERLAIGMKASYDCKLNAGVILRPELRLAWQHEFGDVVSSTASSFAPGGGGTFDAVGPEIGRDSLLIGAGFAVQWTNRCTTYVYYDGEVGRTNYVSNAVSGGIRISF